MVIAQGQSFSRFNLAVFCLLPVLKNVRQGLYCVTVAHNATGALCKLTQVILPKSIFSTLTLLKIMCPGKAFTSLSCSISFAL